MAAPLATETKEDEKRRGRSEDAEEEDYVLIDDVKTCARVLGALLDDESPTQGEEVAVDFEGVNLCRTGELCLAQVARRSGPVLLLDIVTMGAEEAFEAGRLRELLESECVLKIGYDGRADADALFHRHACMMCNFYDVQVAFGLWRDAKNDRWDPFVKGLKRAMEECTSIEPAQKKEMAALQDEGRCIFAPERGGSYEAWMTRPMDKRLMEYAAADVQHLHAMKDEWGSHVDLEDVIFIATERIKEVRTSCFSCSYPGCLAVCVYPSTSMAILAIP